MQVDIAKLIRQLRLEVNLLKNTHDCLKMHTFCDVILMTIFGISDDVIKMPSYMIFLKFNYVLTNLQDHKPAKSCIFGPLRPNKIKIPDTSQTFFCHELMCYKIS